MEEYAMDFEQLEPGDPSEKSAATSSDYCINRAPLRKHAQLADHEKESSYQDARAIFNDVQGFSHMKGTIHQISFADPFIPADFKLLELDKGILDEIVQGGSELTFRGQLSDMCVLCTKDKTFQIKEVEASNSFLIFPKLDVDAVNRRFETNELIQSTAVSVTSTYLEVTEAPPVFSSRLRDLLKINVLDLYEATQNSTSVEKNVTFKSLLDEIQMSEKQLLDELNKYPTIEHNGFLYLLCEDTQSRIMDEVVELCDNSPSSSEFGIHKLTYDFLKQKLSKSVTSNAINWFLRSFCDKSDDAEAYSLNEERMSRARAVQILHGLGDRSKEWMLAEFEKKIEPLLPNGLKFKLDYLKGVAFLTDSIVTGKTILCLDVEDLPSDVHRRLEKLFSMQTMWRKEDIAPFVLDFCSHPSKVEEFLLKHCRILRRGHNQERFFSLKVV